jgi:cysteine desulfurase family protein
MLDKYIYLDNAATTFPKPPAVLSSMIEIYGRLGVSPGRGSYDLASEAETLVEETRTKLARFFGAPDPKGVIFASNATDALNLAIQGLINPGDHVVSTRLEHNSVLRPLHHLRQRGMIEYDLVPFDNGGFIDPHEVAAAIRSDTRLVVINHASNVLGTIQPIREIGRICAERNIPLLIDAAQSAGVVEIDMDGWQIAAIAFTGHKGLLGPTGIGGLILRPELEIRTTRFGGTGVDSRSPIHTQTLPHRLEAGTLNLLGIIGLSAGLDFLAEEGIDAIRNREMDLLRRLRDGLSALDRVELYGAGDLSNHLGLLTANVKGMDPSDVGAILDGDFGIAVRVGLHCAPLVHEKLGTFPNGGVRFSLGPFNTMQELTRTIEAMTAISEPK